MNTDTELLRKLVELAEKASPAPFEYDFPHQVRLKENGYLVASVTPPSDHARGKERREDGEISRANAEFFVAARNAMPALSRLLAGVPEGWIPVGERLPEPLTPVLVNCTFFLDGEDNIHLLYMKPNEMKWRFDDTQDDLLGDGWKPTHWRYLPDGPKGASHE